MKPFHVLVYISYVNIAAKACLLAAVFSQLSMFTTVAYVSYCPDGECRNQLGVAHSDSNELLHGPTLPNYRMRAL